MGNLEVVARFKVRPGQLEGLKSVAADILRLTREQDRHTLRCDWFVSEDGTESEVHELFPDEQGLIEHKMNTMEATTVLFRDYAFDHQSSLYGEVSADFVKLVTERMGPPNVFAFVQGLDASASGSAGEPAGRHLEVIARLKVRPGEFDGCTAQAAEIIRLTREKDTKTLRYDWFLNEDKTQWEVHEGYVSEEGLIEHHEHVVEVRNVLFRDFATDHRMSVYGEISPHMTEMFNKHAGGVGKFTLVEGLERAVSV